jgi:formiminotetrahydrofolate cyclodeaminase
MLYANGAIKRYLDDLAARRPAPGGGSACALTACLGMSLVSMVANFTIGNPKYKKYEKRIKTILSASEKLRKEFLNLTDLDVLAYRSKNIRKAIEVPRRVSCLCLEGIRLCPELAGKGNINLISDVGVAAALLEAAFTGAYLNIKINFKYLNDKAYAKKLKKEMGGKIKAVRDIRRQVEVCVGEIIGR